MKKSDFYYDLPGEAIAQTPASPRDAARLMRLDRRTGKVDDFIFQDLPGLLNPGDLLVANNSKVLPARLLGQRANGGLCEILLLRERVQDLWECLARPGKRLRPGTVIPFGDGTLTAEIIETLEGGNKLVRFSYDTATLYEKLDSFGNMPLPPYITEKLEDPSEYQTVYAKAIGSAAAPTAGLHFTPALLNELREKGIGFAELTLHVGLGTFRPVQENTIEDHVMHTEWYSISQDTATAINAAKQRGDRVIAVGTTSCRVLEAVAQQHGRIQAAEGETDIFIYSGYTFCAIDGLITNFHLPESTLLMLVAALCGKDAVMQAYQRAIDTGYRFFSFGDAMIIL